jgi:hypothetical protein
MHTHCGQLIIKRLGILRRGKVAIIQTPISNRARHPVHKLAHRILALIRVQGTIKIFRGHHIRRKHGPELRNLDLILLENLLALAIADLGMPALPLDTGKRATCLTR